MTRRPNGFTLIELLVVVSIIALLVSILLPALSRARSLAKRIVCVTNVKSITTALHMYANDWDDNFPPMAPLDDNPYWTHQQDTNVYQGNDFHRVHLGLIFPDYLDWDAGKDVLFCPLATAKPEDGYGYHTPEEPWPWDPENLQGSSGYSYHDRLGWGDDGPGGPPTPIRVTNTDPGEAIVADVVFFKFHDRLKAQFASGKSAHDSGWSAGYADGSVEHVISGLANLNGASSMQHLVWYELRR